MSVWLNKYIEMPTHLMRDGCGLLLVYPTYMMNGIQPYWRTVCEEMSWKAGCTVSRENIRDRCQ